MKDKVRGYEIKDEAKVKKEAKKNLKKLHEMAGIDIKKIQNHVFSGMEGINVKKPQGPIYVEVDPSNLDRRMYLKKAWNNDCF
jgi:hypothetical protein